MPRLLLLGSHTSSCTYVNISLSKSINIYRLVFVAFVYVGATVSLALVWDFADLMNGLMAIPNLIGIFLLGRIIKAETDRYFKKN